MLFCKVLVFFFLYFFYIIFLFFIIIIILYILMVECKRVCIELLTDLSTFNYGIG